MPNEIYPLRLEPLLSPRVWGGDRLHALLGGPTPVPGADPIGESWMVYRDNVVLNGRWAGETLATVAARLGSRLLGIDSVARYGDEVPLLTKFIDAAAPLSVQVHPDDAYARVHERSFGKSEAWYVLQADADAAVLWGFRQDETPATIQRAVAEGSLEQRMNRVPVAAGDVIYNPAGTVHAILAGILVFEVQQSSDVTYRLYDYGRLGSDGRPRTLHLERALAVASLKGEERARVEPVQLADGWRRRIACPHFVLDTRELSFSAAEDGSHGVASSTEPGSFQLLQLCRGQATLTWDAGSVALDVGASVVVPAALGAYVLEGDAEVTRCALPLVR